MVGSVNLCINHSLLVLEKFWVLASCSSNSWRDLNSWAQSTHEKGAYIIASISEDLSVHWHGIWDKL
jgi:hypothetical protein